MTTPWSVEPLERARLMLLARLETLESVPEVARDFEWTADYARTYEGLATTIRLIGGATPTPAAPEEALECYTYLLNAANGLWKIGQTRHLHGRRATINRQSPIAVWLHSYIVSDRALEGRLHARWKRYRTLGEWFQFPDRLIAKVQKSMMAGAAAALAARERRIRKDAERAERARRAEAIAAADAARWSEIESTRPVVPERVPDPPSAEEYAHLMQLRAFRLGRGPRP